MTLPLFLVLFLCANVIASARNKNGEYTQAALSFIENMQNPSNCTDVEYSQVEMGCGGGFAAHFQLAASEWLRLAKAVNFSKPVLIIGHIRGYSDGAECSSVKSDWSCFFEPMSACQETLIASGKRSSISPYHTIDEQVIPPIFEHLGLAFWWGIVQTYMFRMRPEIKAYVMHEASKMDHGKGFPFDVPIAGVHVRHGDKASDGFRAHSLEAEMSAIRKSPECVGSVASSKACFSSISLLAEGSNNTSSSSSNNSSNVGRDAKDDTQLRIFVASDDANVLAAAEKMGHLVDTAGISQSTAGAGMFTTLVAHPEKGYNASLEIIADIYYLSRCSTLIGISASQVFRMAVGISNATGVLNYSVAMDHNQLPRIRQMSKKYGLPLPEVFELP